jgi:oxygen-independent coproporphyrinogen III oxidase
MVVAFMSRDPDPSRRDIAAFLRELTMLSLYVHIPFCARKCPYCGFFSTPYDTAQADAFLDALARELDLHAGLLASRDFATLYLGGGTPTALTSDQLSRLFALLRQRLRLTPGAEITVEANPATAAPDVLALLRRSGVTRLSIGVQSFADDVLAVLGRIHTAGQAVQAVRDARDAGFDSLGIDLIYGVPQQTGAQWRSTLEEAIRLRPHHLSAYCLSADAGSRLAGDVGSGAVTLPDEETAISMYRTAVEVIEAAGYRQYELSNFALPGRESRHNTNYWERGEYLGLGPGAASFLGNRRWENIADIAAYCARLSQGGAVADRCEELSREQRALEALLLGLRMTAGIDLGRYGERYGSERRDRLLLRVRELAPHRLLMIDQGRLRLTRRGMVLAQEVLARIAA